MLIYDHYLTNKAYFSDITVTKIYQFYPQDGGENQLG